MTSGSSLSIRRSSQLSKVISRIGGVAATEATAAEIKDHVRERHSKYAYPREIEFVDDLPKTLTGKIRRVELREAERERKKAAQAAS